ncbi:HNH endonuclease [Flavitalea sp.]|nr:HNH endonuclease [Flavitalea sp.]
MKNLIQELYKDELASPSTNFFILDAAGEPHSHEDVDFVKYGYSTARYNKINPGDLFLYRRPKNASRNGVFYFYGCGKVGDLVNVTKQKQTFNDVNISISVVKPLRLERYVLASDLQDYSWSWKPRGKDWANFFSQYGMNQIKKEDFLAISHLGFDGSSETDGETLELEVMLHKKMQQEDYSVEDVYGKVKTRGTAQKIFAQQLQENYRGACCITGISTRSLLCASHIIPWSENTMIRIDPTNGLLLSPLMDRLFDRYYISIDSQYKILVSDRIAKD